MKFIQKSFIYIFPVLRSIHIVFITMYGINVIKNEDINKLEWKNNWYRDATVIISLLGFLFSIILIVLIIIFIMKSIRKRKFIIYFINVSFIHKIHLLYY